jgi:gluconate 5-dehydrogenase
MSLEERFGLDGKVALVTGGSRGLGLEIARALGDAGASLALSARREVNLRAAEQQLVEQGLACQAFQADISSADQASELVSRVLAAYGRLDILVNNAGIAWAAPALDLPLDRWQRVVDTNLTGTFLCSQAAGRQMARQGGGRIVNLTSVAGLLGTEPELLDTIPYSATKAAIVGLTRDLAVKWARHGVLVNAVAPWFVPTHLSDGVIARAEKAMIERVPLRRLGTPAEVANVVLFLAGPAATYITGQVIAVDGGVTAS